MKDIKTFCLFGLLGWALPGLGQQEAARVKMEHEQIGIVDDAPSSYRHTSDPGAQWYPDAAFGLFVHWSIASVRRIDLSWPMMAGTQIGWRSPLPDTAVVEKYLADGDYWAGHPCRANNTCVTPRAYWEQAKEFNPRDYDPDKWIKAAKDAGMTYAVLTCRHHDGFALWPSRYGNFNTKNYMGGRDLVKEFVAACRKYGLKVGLYYSGPDWYFNKAFQSFMYYGVGKHYPGVPSLDEDLHPRTTSKTDAQKQAQYEAVAAYVKGQVEELLTQYGKIDLIWFDGSPDIPRGNPAWKDCISMERIHELQPGIVVSPRFFGYGDYTTFEGDKKVPAVQQDGWAELCMTSANPGWGYTSAPLKQSGYLIDKLASCRAMNTNLLLNFGPTSDGVYTKEEYGRLHDIARWMKVNGEAIRETRGLSSGESAGVPATAKGNVRYLFLYGGGGDRAGDSASGDPAAGDTVLFKTAALPQSAELLEGKKKLSFLTTDGVIRISVPAGLRSAGTVVVIKLTLYPAGERHFTLFNSLHYKNTPDLEGEGLHRLNLVYENRLNDPGHIIDSEKIGSVAQALRGDPAPVTLDIESWPFWGTPDALPSTIDKYLRVVRIFKQQNPASPIGFYGVVPRQAFRWSSMDPVSNPKGYAGWLGLNEAMRPVAGAVDVFFPSFYTYDADTVSWLKMVDSTVSAIKRYSGNKPVYAYIWPQYHEDKVTGGRQFIDTAVWRFQLEALYSRVDGAVIWSSNKDHDGNIVSWYDGMPWWIVTRSFIKEHHIK